MGEKNPQDFPKKKQRGWTSLSRAFSPLHLSAQTKFAAASRYFCRNATCGKDQVPKVSGGVKINSENPP